MSRIEQRVAEAEKLGFNHVFVAAEQVKGLREKFKGIKISGFARLDEVFKAVFSGE